MKTKRRLLLYILLTVLIIGYLVPESFQMPVQGASHSDFNHESFWYHPWGASGVHKGVDIFARKNTPIHPATRGLVIYSGQIKMGGNVVTVLGPKWRLHYYAHLAEIRTGAGSFVGSSDVIGTVGDSGNAAGKAPHLHYSILTLIPYIWKADDSPQGWKKMFYLDPVSKLLGGND